MDAVLSLSVAKPLSSWFLLSLSQDKSLLLAVSVLLLLILFITLFWGNCRKTVKSASKKLGNTCASHFESWTFFFCMFCLHLFGMWDIMIWLQRMRQESPFLLSTMLSSVHTALSVKCTQKQDFFKMGFRLLYGLDTRWERGGEKRTCCKKRKKKMLLESVLFCFLLCVLSENYYQWGVLFSSICVGGDIGCLFLSQC